jgi:hypothetical protein
MYASMFVCWTIVINTFNNISGMSWRSVLLVEETGVRRENHRPVASHWQTLSHNVVLSTPCHERVSHITVQDQSVFISLWSIIQLAYILLRGRRDCMVVGFTTTCTCTSLSCSSTCISPYPFLLILISRL